MRFLTVRVYSGAKIYHLAVLFPVLLCALKTSFWSLSSWHSSVSQIKDLFLQQACPRQLALMQGWEVLSHCLMSTEEHLALRNLFLWRQTRMALCFEFVPHISPLCRTTEVRKTTPLLSFIWIPAGQESKRQGDSVGRIWLCKEGRNSHAGSASLAPRKGMSLKRDRASRIRKAIDRDSPSGNSSSSHSCCFQ